MPADPSQIPPVEPEQAARRATPPGDSAPQSPADLPPARDRVHSGIGDTVDVPLVQTEASANPPDEPLVPPEDQPVTQKVDPPEAAPTRRWGSLLSDDRAHLLLRFDGADEPLRVVVQERVVLGRAHAQSGFVPDIDLTPYGAHRKGVSREHVAITFRDHMLQIEDLNSMNGSLLNGWALIPHEPRVLRNGDQLVLGRLSLFVAVIRE